MVATYCKKCGTEVGEQAKFCGACGTAVQEASPPTESRSKSHAYKKAIAEGSELPTVNLTVEGGAAPILRKGEAVHFAAESVLKETKTTTQRHAGSRGTSMKVPGVKGMKFRVPSTPGYTTKQQQTVDVSHGVLIVTNKRLFLHPAPGHKPVNIPLNKILSYHGHPNGIDVYKEGRQAGYFFSR